MKAALKFTGMARATAAYLGLAVLGRGGVAEVFCRPALTALAAVALSRGEHAAYLDEAILELAAAGLVSSGVRACVTLSQQQCPKGNRRRPRATSVQKARGPPRGTGRTSLPKVGHGARSTADLPPSWRSFFSTRCRAAVPSV